MVLSIFKFFLCVKGFLTLIKLKIFNDLSKIYKNVSFSGYLFSMKQKAHDSFSQYIMFLEMCKSLIFRDKKGNLIYL